MYDGVGLDVGVYLSREPKFQVGTRSQNLMIRVLVLVSLSGEVGYSTVEAMDGGPSTNECHPRNRLASVYDVTWKGDVCYGQHLSWYSGGVDKDGD